MVSLRLFLIDIKTGFQYASTQSYRVLALFLICFALGLLISVCYMQFARVSTILIWNIRIGRRKIVLSLNKKSFLQFSILFYISLLILLLLMLFRDIENGRGKSEFRDIWIAHALGGIDDKTYTNSREAMLYNYNLGHRTFEVDFSITSDEKIVCLHDWSHGALIQGREKEDVLSKAEFEEHLIYGKYTPISLEEILLFMSEHEDVWIVTDSKECERDLVVFEFSYLVNVANRLGVEEVLDRVIVQIYNQEMYKTVCEIYEFPEFIYTLYQFWDGNVDTFPDICRFCVYNEIDIVTMWYFYATPEIIEIANQFGIDVYVHTVNDIDIVNKLKEEGVQGFYTDFLIYDIPDTK